MRVKRILTAACIMAAALAVTGCGGYYKSKTTTSDFNFKDSDFEVEDSDFEVSKSAGYQKTGSFCVDEYGTTTWYQYAYDEEGRLVSERSNVDGMEGYSEITYNEDGDVASAHPILQIQK